MRWLILAHSFYTIACCGGQDCHPVRCDEIFEQPDGGYIWHDKKFDASRVHPSEDAQCHVCYSGNVNRCIYVQLSG